MLLLAMALAAGGTPPRDAAEKASDSGDKMICKRFLETGSLVRGYRTCKTKREWERERENLRALTVADGCRLRGDGGSC